MAKLKTDTQSWTDLTMKLASQIHKTHDLSQAFFDGKYYKERIISTTSSALQCSGKTIRKTHTAAGTQKVIQL